MLKTLRSVIERILIICCYFYIFICFKKNKNLLARETIDNMLIIDLYAVGDTILSTPFLRELRKNLPNAHFTLLANLDTSNMLEICPYVDEIITIDLPREIRKTDIHTLFRLAKKYLWGKHYDLVFVLSWSFDYRLAILAQLGVRPLRVLYNAYIHTKKRIGLLSWLNRAISFNSRIAEHEVEHNLDLLRYSGGNVESKRLELWTSRSDQLFADKIIVDAQIGQDSFVIAFCPGAHHLNHRWPIENYIALGEWLIDKYANIKILVFGSKEEEALGVKINDNLGEKTVILIGKTSLRQAFALLQKCHLYIGNDTGVIHLAAAAKLPVIGITCHPRSDQGCVESFLLRYRPWQVPNIIIQPEKGVPPCINVCKIYDKQHCVTKISLEQVKKSILKLIESCKMTEPRPA